MDLKNLLVRLWLLALIFATLTEVGCTQPPAPTRQALVSAFPNVEEGSGRVENVNILCPFQRMLERSGLYDEELESQATMTVAASTVTSASETFGCAAVECGSVARLVTLKQQNDGVDLERLHDAGNLSHECGLTFDVGGTQVSDAVRTATLNRLLELADVDGHLLFDDLLTTKLEICDAQGVTISGAEELELKLIYAYLGGVERGYIDHSDVDKLLHANMPETKTSAWINTSLLNDVK